MASLERLFRVFASALTRARVSTRVKQISRTRKRVCALRCVAGTCNTRTCTTRMHVRVRNVREVHKCAFMLVDTRYCENIDDGCGERGRTARSASTASRLTTSRRRRDVTAKDSSPLGKKVVQFSASTRHTRGEDSRAFHYSFAPDAAWLAQRPSVRDSFFYEESVACTLIIVTQPIIATCDKWFNVYLVYRLCGMQDR
jgi:hypothetical protein